MTARAFLVAAALCALPLGPTELFGETLANAEPPVGLQAAANEASAEVIVAYGSNSGKGIDPQLKELKQLKKPPFSAYDSYALLDRRTLSLARGKPADMKLPDGAELKLLLQAVEQHGDHQHFLVKASILKPGGKDELLPGLQVKAKQGRIFFVAGQRFKDGILALGIRVR